MLYYLRSVFSKYALYGILSCWVFVWPAHKLSAQVDVLKTIFIDTTAINDQLHKARQFALAGNVDTAAAIFQRVLDQSKYSLYNYGMVKSLIGLGNTQIYTGAYKKALNTYQRAITYCTTERTQKLIPSIYNNIGVIYGFWGKSGESMIYYEKALDFAEKINMDSSLLETLYSNMAIPMNRLLDQPEKALFYLRKAEPIAQKKHNYNALANIYTNKGVAYFALKDWGKSNTCFRAALKIATRHNYPDIQYTAYVNLGNIALNTNRPETALAELEKTKQIKGNINPYIQNARTMALGQAHLMLEHYNLAIFYFKKSLALSEKLNTSKELIRIHGTLSDLYAETGNYKQALEHLDLEKSLNDSVNKQETIDTVSQMEIKYRSALKSKEIAGKQLIINRQEDSIRTRNAWIYGVSACLLLLFIFSVLQWKNYKRKQKLKNEQLQNLMHQQELEIMKALMSGEEKERIRLARELHDNIMTQFSVVKMNLSALAGKETPVLAKENLKPVVDQLDEATENLRHTAHNLMPDMLLQEGLADAIYYFCNNLQKFIPFTLNFQRLGKIPRFNVQFELSVYRIIQELIQNIIKHAAATTAIVQLSFENNLLSITVEDNGKGMSEKKGKENNGLGIKSIYARVASLNGRIDLESEKNIGTTVRIEFDTSLSETPSDTA